MSTSSASPPLVTFIVPCFKLARYLAECVDSILAQTFADLEVLVMDDASPDNTSEVMVGLMAQDSRVRYWRNEKNLGPFANFNKGLELARGSYFWVISADDILFSRHVLERYVGLLEKNPGVGYVFCPAMGLEGESRTEVQPWSAWPGANDRILTGAEVLRRSAYSCPVCAPTGLARKECYDRTGGFPLTFQRVGDWYLWALFAMDCDVGYFAEPMICYRLHQASMEKTMAVERPATFYEEEILVRWKIKQESAKKGIEGVDDEMRRGLADVYAERIVRREVEGWKFGRSLDEVAQQVAEKAADRAEAEEIVRMTRSFVSERLTFHGCVKYSAGDFDRAMTLLRLSLAANPTSLRARGFLWLYRLEQAAGIRATAGLRWLRDHLRSPSHP